MNNKNEKEKALLATFPKHKDVFLAQLKEDKEYAHIWFQSILGDYAENKDVNELVYNLKPLIEANSTLCDFAKKININRITLYKIFSRKMVPSIEVLNKIFNGLGFELILSAKKA